MLISRKELQGLLDRQREDDARLHGLLLDEIDGLKVQLADSQRAYRQLVDSVMESRGIPPPHAAREAGEPRPIPRRRPVTWAESRRALEGRSVVRARARAEESLSPIAQAAEASEAATAAEAEG